MFTLLTALASTLGPATAAYAVQPNDQDRRLLVALHQATFAQVELGRLAEQKATTQVVRQTARSITASHVELDPDVGKTADALGVSLPNEPDATLRTAAAELAALSGTAFDRRWIDVQRRLHDELMDRIQADLGSGGDQRARQLAATAEPIVASHRDTLRKAAHQVSPPVTVDSGLGGAAGPPAEVVVLAGVGVLVLLGGVWLRRRTAR
ncbi:MAG: DUF4142 domain-containing protein [Streptomycetaceae bacterium]|nr:DUF4142 domain-containing protein [Streptomycetaceae bacterium]